jgi:hypothetical protein
MIDQLRMAIRYQPFHLFTICMAEGRALPVSHPEFVSIHPHKSRTFVIAGPDEDYKMVDRFLVSSRNFGQKLST